ncbi:MAG: hypothetical protein MJ249_11935 [Kiritimatiellae bacterium]|nr:hypothetical protein [Kiritimatiellia bacterium]
MSLNVPCLDDKCGKIDELLTAKEKEVKLLKELKQTVIADAVTRGISHAESVAGVSSPRSLCSPRENNRRLVPSRIPRLPQIPEGWHLVRNKSFPRLTDEKVGDRKSRFTLLSLTKHGDIMRLFVHEFGSIRTA